jgi:hypothetical protein
MFIRQLRYRGRDLNENVECQELKFRSPAQLKIERHFSTNKSAQRYNPSDKPGPTSPPQ